MNPFDIKIFQILASIIALVMEYKRPPLSNSNQINGGSEPSDNYKKKISVIIMLIFVISSLFYSLIQSSQEKTKHEQRINFISEHIIDIIGCNERTFDQIYMNLTVIRTITFSEANETIENLLEQNSIGSKMKYVYDNQNRLKIFQIIVFYNKKTNNC